MELKDLTEAERLIIEKLRLLRDGASFDLIPEAFVECLDILLSRDKAYNNGQTAYAITFANGDVSMLEAVQRPALRARGVVSDGNGALRIWVPEEDMNEIPHDGANYNLLWIANRKYRERNGAQN